MLHDAAALRSSFDHLGQQYIEFTRSLTEDALALPGLGEWTVRELLGHAIRAFSTAAHYLDAPATKDHRMRTPGEYYRGVLASSPGIHADVAERGKQAGAALGDDPGDVAGTVSTIVEAARARVAAADDDADVNTFAGQISLLSYLATRIVEGGVHLLDLQRAVGRPVGLDPHSAQIVLLTLAETGDVTTLILALAGRSQLPPGYNVLQ